MWKRYKNRKDFLDVCKMVLRILMEEPETRSLLFKESFKSGPRIVFWIVMWKFMRLSVDTLIFYEL